MRLNNYQPFYAVKADFLVKLGQNESAKKNFSQAIKMSNNQQVKNFLKTKLLLINQKVTQ
jgi:predicted RNA polymerase sigma factor